MTLNGIEEFLGRDKILQRMRESSAALKRFLAANQSPTRPPHVGGEVEAQPPPGDTLAYRDTLDKLPWDKALQKGVAAFVYRAVRFLTKEGILRSVAATGNHIPVTAAPSGDCRKCTSLRVEEGKRRHWHFPCPHRS